MRVQLPRFWRRKEKEVVEVKKSELEKKPEKEFPGITAEEQRKYIGDHVAIVDGKIAIAARSAGQVLSRAKKRYPDKKVVLRYVASEKLLLKCRCFLR